MSDTPNLNRRGFLAGAGAFALSAVLPPEAEAAAKNRNEAMRDFYFHVTGEAYNQVMREPLAADKIKTTDDLVKVLNDTDVWAGYTQALLVAARAYLTSNPADAPYITRSLQETYAGNFGFSTPLMNDIGNYSGGRVPSKTNPLLAHVFGLIGTPLLNREQGQTLFTFIEKATFSEAVYSGLKAIAIEHEAQAPAPQNDAGGMGLKL